MTWEPGRVRRQDRPATHSPLHARRLQMPQCETQRFLDAPPEHIGRAWQYQPVHSETPPYSGIGVPLTPTS